MIRKLMVKRTMSPILPKKETLIHNKDGKIKYLESDLIMKQCQTVIVEQIDLF